MPKRALDLKVGIKRKALENAGVRFGMWDKITWPISMNMEYKVRVAKEYLSLRGLGDKYNESEDFRNEVMVAMRKAKSYAGIFEICKNTWLGGVDD